MTLLFMVGLVAFISIILVILGQIFRCKHAWEFVDKTELPSRLEEAKKSGTNLATLWAYQVQEMSEKKVIIVLRCPKCGQPKILKESN